MKFCKKATWLVVALVSVLVATRCAENEVTQTQPQESSELKSATSLAQAERDLNSEKKAETSEEVAPASQKQIDQAAQFARFLKKQLPQKELDALLEQCSNRPSENEFCFSVVNFERFESNLKKARRGKVVRSKRLRPKIVKGEIANWDEMRGASINSLLKGINASSPSEIRKMDERAKAETACPNNVAAALAASYEDDLPESVSPLDLAKLYEKGGKCQAKEPADQETLLCRAGLFYFLGQHYTEAEAAFAQASSVEKAFTARSLYWLFRARTALKDSSGAEKAIEQLRSKYPFSFHTLVALTTNSQDPGDILKKTASLAIKRSQTAPDINHLIDQVELLRRIDYREAASKVLSWAIADAQEAEPELRLYLAELKNDMSDYGLRISLLSEVLYKFPSLVTRETMDLYFPKVYFPIFEKNASGIDPYFLLSVARQESAFNQRAVSRAKAKGLLQILPKTARRFWSQKKMDLTDPDTNVQIGSRYLQELLRKTNGQVHFALAAYNAGESRIAIWETRYQTTEPVLFIDLIPYRETREYVASILRNYFWYRRIHAPADVEKKVFDLNITKNS